MCVACVVQAAAKKPNVVILVADQWRAQAFGFAGDPNVHTPNLDRLANCSVNVTNAISGCPVCSPFRASLLTGQRPLTHGVFVNDVPLNTNAVAIAKVLKNAGYNTACIGKWHVDGRGRKIFIPRERRQGFDYWKVLECTHDYNDSEYFADTSEKLKWDGYDAFAQTADAKKYIADHAQNSKPFLLLLTWGPPHNPYETAPAEYRRMYQAQELTLRPNVPAANADRARKDLAGYYAHCTAIDKCVGDLWQTLKDAGIDRDTLIVFVSDHGDMQWSQGKIRKQRPWDESIRIPLLIHYPAAFGDAGKKVGALVNAQDLMPTLLGLCKVRVPKSAEGFDYSRYLTSGTGNIPEAAVIMCPVPFSEFSKKAEGREYRGIRTDRYTYVRDLNGPWLLYDNQTDPYQLTNLCNRADSKQIQAALEKELSKKLRESHDDFLPAAAYMQQWNYVFTANGATRVRE
jgi:arylsulfatase A-like enzyme